MVFANLAALLEAINLTASFELIFARSPQEYQNEYGLTEEVVTGVLSDLQVSYDSLQVTSGIYITNPRVNRNALSKIL